MTARAPATKPVPKRCLSEKSRLYACALAATSLVAGCSTMPSDAFVDRLDPDTAITVTVLTKPVELVSDPSFTTADDPFAYVAPFETNRMGERALYLWMSVSQKNAPLTEPTLVCDGKTLALPALAADLTQLGLSSAPYESPAPWNGQWYFRLPPEALECFGTVQSLELKTQTSQAENERFSVKGKTLGPLNAFAHR